MTIQILYLYLTWLVPLVLVPIFTYSKKPIYFIIGIQISFYFAHNFYETYLSLNLYDIDDSWDIKLKAIELHRDKVFFNLLKSNFITLLYVVSLGSMFWYIIKNKNIKTQETLKKFLNSSVFYLLLFMGSLIDLLLGFGLTVEYWKFSIFSFLFLLPFLIKSISLKKVIPKKEVNGKTSKITWFLLILLIVFYTYVWFFTRST